MQNLLEDSDEKGDMHEMKIVHDQDGKIEVTKSDYKLITDVPEATIPVKSSATAGHTIVQPTVPAQPYVPAHISETKQ